MESPLVSSDVVKTSEEPENTVATTVEEPKEAASLETKETEPVLPAQTEENVESVVKPSESVVKDDSVANNKADDELSWEKIASEITESDAATDANDVSAASVESFQLESQQTASETSYEAATEDVIQPTTKSEETPTKNETATEEIKEDIATESPEKPTVTEVIEISELKPEEEASTSTEAIEYTVIEAEDVETNEIIEKHLAQTTGNTSETLLIINESGEEIDATVSPYQEEIYVLEKDEEPEEPEETVQEVKEDVKVKKPRGRKPISDIPLHVLGRDISKPKEGVSNGGRVMPKPRLGVKVPYRNLTSQIVSKADIEKEIMDRFKTRQEQNPTTPGDVMFARKLTQRLAKKLIPDKDSTNKKAIETKTESGTINSGIKDDSDLIAILEGKDDEKKHKIGSSVPMDPEKEREIALQQLKELPEVAPSPKNRIFKSKTSPVEEKPKITLTPAKVIKTEDKKKEVEPRLKTGMVVKTYTRKRKSTEGESTTPAPSKKSSADSTVTPKSDDNIVGNTTNVYVTKSSRVIKRKVIWDPDETPTTPAKSPIKKETTTTTTPATKIVPKTEKKTEKTTPQVAAKKVTAKTTTTSPPIKKRLTEVDKLLMDEGAINMLYDMKTTEDNDNNKIKKKQAKIKDFLSKTNAIKNDLQQTTTKDPQKSLRKKEIAPTTPAKKNTTTGANASPKKEQATTSTGTPSAVTRKKSKDSVRSSIHSPPASPGFNTAEASRIIRRHSSSSFSSDNEDEEDIAEEVEEQRVTRKRSNQTVVEPVKKRTKKNSETKTAKETATTVAKTNNNNTVNHKDSKDKNIGEFKTFTATKSNKLVSIQLYNENSGCFLSELLLKELTGCLQDLGQDDDCNVVSITSTNKKIFCKGLDYKVLVNLDDTKKRANEIATLVKEFLKCLLYFPKVLVAGIEGDCHGLGVTMLPLFDMVIASDTSTFSTPYAKLGCVAEAGFLLTIPHLGNHGLASELLYTSQVLKADDVFRRGLITRLCWPEKYNQDLNNILTDVASRSSQSIEATKLQLRKQVLEITEKHLNSLGKVLVEHWTSAECQKNFTDLDHPE